MKRIMFYRQAACLAALSAALYAAPVPIVPGPSVAHAALVTAHPMASPDVIITGAGVGDSLSPGAQIMDLSPPLQDTAGSYTDAQGQQQIRLSIYLTDSIRSYFVENGVMDRLDMDTEEDSPPDDGDSGGTAELYDVPAEQQVYEMVTAERARAGLSALLPDARLAELARVRAREIAVSFSHTRPDGSGCFTLLEDAGLSYKSCGENLASGYTAADSVMEGWMNSPSHERNILSPSYIKTGVGCYLQEGVRYWVQLFLYD